VPQCICTVAASPVTAGKLQVSSSACAAARGSASILIWSAAGAGFWKWNSFAFGSSTRVQRSACGTHHTEYCPAATFVPFRRTSRFSSSVVAQFAPVHGSPYGTSSPKSVRPAARGREYSIVTVVPSIVCDTTAASLPRI
jgi:hypothetical protein